MSKVVRSSGSASNLEFVYDATGNRIMKIEQKRPSGVLDTQKDWKYTYYVRDAQGNVMATYSRSYAGSGTSYTDNFSVQEFPVYGSSRLGVRAGTDIGVQATSFTSTIGADGTFGSRSYSSNPSPPACSNCSYSRTLGYKSYELSNHLGNVLNVVSDRKLSVDAYTYTAAPNGNYIYMPSSGTYAAVTAGTGTYNQSAGADGKAESYKADVISYTDYYSFGMLMPGRNGNSGDYRYGFNGKESDSEWDGGGSMYDYGFRIYNPRLGKFLSVDPLAPDYPWYTPYQFAGNRPIECIDIDGLEEISYTFILHNGKPKCVLVTDYRNTGGISATLTRWFFGNYNYGPLGQGTAVHLILPDGRMKSWLINPWGIVESPEQSKVFTDAEADMLGIALMEMQEEIYQQTTPSYEDPTIEAAEDVLTTPVTKSPNTTKTSKVQKSQKPQNSANTTGMKREQLVAELSGGKVAKAGTRDYKAMGKDSKGQTIGVTVDVIGADAHT